MAEYDARVRQADRMIERLFGVLRARRLLDRAMVVITADHGERLGEHGTFFHGGPPDQAATAIPILIFDDRAAAWPARTIASQIDIAPTFLRAIGGASLPGWRGEPLQRRSRRDAVPLGTSESVGTVAAVSGNVYRYLCDRDTGAETVALLDGRRLEGRRVRSPALLRSLRARRRQVDGPVSGPCDR